MATRGVAWFGLKASILLMSLNDLWILGGCEMSGMIRICLATLLLVAAFGEIQRTANAAVNFDSQLVGGAANGDFNSDGNVNAADYTVWRDHLGGTTALPNDNGLGTPIGTAHYDLWKNGFGSTGGSNTFAFEDPSIWDAPTYNPVPSVGQEDTPPGPDSIWFAENNPADATLILTDERTGENGSEPMGTFAYGGESGANNFNSKFTLVLNNSVTLTGTERTSTGEPSTSIRPLRLGRENINPLSTVNGGTTETAPWAILLHKAGTFKYADGVTASMDFSRDKTNSAGSVYEISGNATLNLSGSVRLGDRDNGGSRTVPGSIFRVRGSNATIAVDDYINESRLGLWDRDNVVDADNPTGITQMHLGKFVTEFVLDANGASTINVNDELRIGRSETLPDTVTQDPVTQVGYGFLRMKLSEPTMAGSGAAGSGNEIVLFRYGRVTASLPEFAGSEIAEGRFFDPDRSGLNPSGDTMLPHAGLWNGGTVRADYAGATYQWTINYFEGVGIAPDPSLDNTVTLSNLAITGTPGDLSGNGTLGPEDRVALVNAIAAPPTIAIATAQNLFDLNADEIVSALDLAVFDAHFMAGIGSIAAVPEPATVLLCLAGAFGVLGLRRRNA